MWTLFDIHRFPLGSLGNVIRLGKGLNKMPYFIEMHKNPTCIIYGLCSYNGNSV